MLLKYSVALKQNTYAIAILLICIIAIYNWFISPNTRYLAAADKYTKLMESTEKQSKVILNQLGQHRKTLNKLNHDFKQKKQAFFDNDQAKSFISGLQSESEKSGCSVTNLQLRPLQNIAVKDNNSIDFGQYQIVMTFSGNYENIVNFINTLQKGPLKVWVDAINVSAKASTNGSLSCDITLSIFTLKIKENTNNVNNKKT